VEEGEEEGEEGEEGVEEQQRRVLAPPRCNSRRTSGLVLGGLPPLLLLLL